MTWVPHFSVSSDEDGGGVAFGGDDDPAAMIESWTKLVFMFADWTDWNLYIKQERVEVIF